MTCFENTVACAMFFECVAKAVLSVSFVKRPAKEMRVFQIATMQKTLILVVKAILLIMMQFMLRIRLRR